VLEFLSLIITWHQIAASPEFGGHAAHTNKVLLHARARSISRTTRSRGSDKRLNGAAAASIETQDPALAVRIEVADDKVAELIGADTDSERAVRWLIALIVKPRCGTGRLKAPAGLRRPAPYPLLRSPAAIPLIVR
jgi:hypothetical protein